MTIINKDGTETEISDDSSTARAYRALAHAADRMGKSGHRAHAVSKYRKQPYTPTAEHSAIIKAMPALLAGEISPEEAMAMLHEYDTLKQRTA